MYHVYTYYFIMFVLVHLCGFGCVGRVGMPQKIFNPPSQFSRLGIHMGEGLVICTRFPWLCGRIGMHTEVHIWQTGIA